MASETIFCPACNNKLRVPDDLMGQEVQCPKCQRMFTAPPPPPNVVRAADHSDEPPRRMPLTPTDVDDLDRWDDGSRPRGRSRRMAPAIAMIAVGVLHSLLNLYGAIVSALQPEEVRKQFQQLQAMFPGMAVPPVDLAKLNLLAGSVFFVLSILQVIGGISMLKGRFYPFALAGAFLSIVNCNDACCLASIPIGIWALVVLFDSNVKAEFV